MKNLAIIASGSGGHILPALVLAKDWKKNHFGEDVFFFGRKKKLDQKILEDSDFLSEKVFFDFINFPGKKVWLYPKFLFQFLSVFITSFFYLKKYRINRIISTGGYIAIPFCLAGKVLGCQIDLFELNVEPGKAIKLMSFFADKIFITFDKSREFFGRVSKKCFLSSYPLRFTVSDKQKDKKGLIEFFGFNEKKKTIFLLGGSQGSLFLDNTFKDWINDNNNVWENIQVIHQTGIDNVERYKKFYAEKNISAFVFSYINNIKDFYILADLVLSRAGAGALFELEFFAKKCLIIPLETRTTLHQVFNAQEMVKRYPDLFDVLNQHQIKKNKFDFSEKMQSLLS